MKITKAIVTFISILAVSASVLAQDTPLPPGGPDGPPPGGPGGPPPGGPGGPPPGVTGGPPPAGPDGFGGPGDDTDDDMTVEDVIAAVGPECAQYVPSEPPSDAASFLASVPDSCKSVFAGLLSE